MPTTPLPYDVFKERCPSRAMLSDVAKRWSVLVLDALDDGPRRFSCLSSDIEGISDRMLSQTLKALIAEGLVEHCCDGYRLSDSGQPIAARVRELIATIYSTLRTQNAN